LTYYRNGVESGSRTFTQPLDEPQPLFLGGDNEGAAGENWSGLMSDVRIYDRALSADEISRLVGPIVHYKLDDGEGVMAVDSADGLDGILMGDPQWSTGVFDGALDFDGDGDYVDCGTSDALNNLSDAITVSAWVSIRSVSTTWMSIVMKGETAWRLGVNGDTTGIHWGFTGGDRGWQAANSVTELPLNEWHHIAGTYDRSVGGTVYVDGVAETVNPDPDGVATNEMPLLLGENPEALGRFFDGILDDVRIYDRALSADELSGLAPPLAVKINFQSLTQGSGEVPEGYLPDYGEVFGDRGNGFSYGWDMDIQGDARDRNSANAVDQRYDTLNHLQKNSIDKTWEIELPNGTYDVFMVCGDPDNTDQIDSFDVEGVVVEDPDGEDNFDEYALTVEVSDGLLTIKPAAGASNCKLMFVDITGK